MLVKMQGNKATKITNMNDFMISICMTMNRVGIELSNAPCQRYACKCLGQLKFMSPASLSDYSSIASQDQSLDPDSLLPASLQLLTLLSSQRACFR